MPLNLSHTDRRLLAIVTAIFIAVSAIALMLAPSSDERAKIATTYSAGPEGTKAAYLLLQESGYRSERWELPPDELKAADNALVLLLDPDVPPTQEEQQAVRRFVSSGGTLVLSGTMGAYFVEADAPAPSVDDEAAEYGALSPSAEERAAPTIRLQPAATWNRDGGGIALYGDEKHAVVMQFPSGKGQIVWLASSSLLSNAGLSDAHNLDFLLALAGSRDRPVLWDEYFHGHRRTPATAGASPQVRWLFLQLAVLAAAVLATYSRRSGPMRAPVVESRLSPLEFTQALGELYAHARAANVALDINYGRFRHWLTRRLGMRANASPVELARAAGHRWPISEAEFLATLQACESARFYPDLTRKEALELVKRLFEYAKQFKLFPGIQENR